MTLPFFCEFQIEISTISIYKFHLVVGAVFMKHARKPQAFKPGDEWHPFEASQVEPGEAEEYPT